VLEDFISRFGIDPLPRTPVFTYLFRAVCGVFGLIGLFYVLLTRNPMGYGRMLELGGYGLLIFGLLALITGASAGITLIVYFGDGIFGVILGTLISILSLKLRKSIQ
jgi:FtsH-binding integral membrane protein